MANIKKFEDLKIWQGARILVGTVYSIMKDNKDFGLEIKFKELLYQS